MRTKRIVRGDFRDRQSSNSESPVFWGCWCPKSWGGGGGFEEMASVLETLAQSCASTAMVVLMHYCATAVIAAQASSLES